jgi:hypothetical protein
MIHAGSNQDWKSIFTYVNSLYSDLTSHKKKLSGELNAEADDDNGANSDDNGAVHGNGNDARGQTGSVDDEE